MHRLKATAPIVNTTLNGKRKWKWKKATVVGRAEENHASFRKPWPGGEQSKRKLKSHETEVQYSAGYWLTAGFWLVKYLLVSHWLMSGMIADYDVYVNIQTLHSIRNILSFFFGKVRSKKKFVIVFPDLFNDSLWAS